MLRYVPKAFVYDHPLVAAAREQMRRLPTGNMHADFFWRAEHSRRVGNLTNVLKRNHLYGASIADQVAFLSTYKMRVRVLAPIRSVA